MVCYMYTKIQQDLLNAIKTNFIEIDNYSSITELLLSLGICSTKPNGRRISEAKNVLIELGFDISHFSKNGKKPATLIHKVCPVCGNSFSYPSYSREKTTCGYACSNTYFRSGKDNPNYKTGYSYRKIAIHEYGDKCYICGEDIVVEVHHKDSNRGNNTIDNLVVLCPTHHTAVHKGIITLL